MTYNMKAAKLVWKIHEWWVRYTGREGVEEKGKKEEEDELKQEEEEREEKKVK